MSRAVVDYNPDLFMYVAIPISTSHLRRITDVSKKFNDDVRDVDINNNLLSFMSTLSSETLNIT
jgi:hypothetical protein